VITYNIGAPDLTDGLYVFDEDPFCNYPETVTVTNLPTFATHNTGSIDFTIPQTSDLNLMGEYIVTINSQICVPDDYTANTCSIMQVEYDFVIYMEPCLVNSYSASSPSGIINYTIGAATETGGLYLFEESPACLYA